MAKINVPVVIDGYKCVEDMAQAVLDYRYHGKTLKEWADAVSNPQTNADRIRGMSDEELAEWMAINTDCFFCKVKNKNICSLDEGTCTEEWKFWLKSPVEVQDD